MYYDRARNPITVEQYLELSKDPAYKIVQQDYVDEYFVSTVWLGVDHGWRIGEGIVFETMVFDAKTRNKSFFQERYLNERGAKEGHQWVLEQIRNGETEWLN